MIVEIVELIQKAWAGVKIFLNFQTTNIENERIDKTHN